MKYMIEKFSGISLGTLILVAVGMSLIGCQPGANQVNSNSTQSSVKIGMLFPLGTETGTQARNGAELAIRQLNQDFAAVKFEARWEDERGDPTFTATRMEELTADTSIKGIVGPINSGPAVAAADIANQRHEVLISPLASTPTIAKPADYFFRTFPSDAAEARFASEYVQSKLKLTDAVVLHIGAPYGQDLSKAFIENYKALGGKVLDEIEYPGDTKNYNAIVTRVMERKPSVVYFVGYPPDLAEILREFRSLRATFPIVSAAIIADPTVAQLAGQNAEGVIFPFPNTYDGSSPTPQMVKFHELYKAQFNADPSFIAAQAYDATMLLGKSIAEVQKKNPAQIPEEEIRKVIENTKTYDGATGTFTFDENGDAVRTYKMFEIKNGKMTPR